MDDLLAEIRNVTASYHNAFNYFARLAEQPDTEIICWNLIREMRFGCCPKDTLVEFLQVLDNYLKINPLSVSKEPRNLFRHIRQVGNFYLVGRNLSSSPSHKDSAEPVEVLPEEETPTEHALCRVQSIETFARFTKPGELFWEESQEMEYAKQVVNKDIKPQGILSSDSGYAWVTRLPLLKEAIQTAPDPWEKTRTILGLPIYQPFILIKYPESFKPDLMVQPTFIEGERPEFRVEPLLDGWNQTVDLSTGDPGLPEAIHSPQRLTDDFEFELIRPRDLSDFLDDEPDYLLLRDKARINLTQDTHDEPRG